MQCMADRCGQDSRNCPCPEYCDATYLWTRDVPPVSPESTLTDFQFWAVSGAVVFLIVACLAAVLYAGWAI